MSPLERAWRGGRSEWRLHFLSVFSVSVAFVCMAAALLVVVNVESLRASWAKSGRASVYLKDGTSRDGVNEIEQALRATPHVKSVRYVSAEEARREVLGSKSDEILAALPEGAFPASIEVVMDDDVQASQVEKLAATLPSLPAVESVETYRGWAERLGALLRAGVVSAALLAIVVLAAVASVVASTIRLTLQKRQTEVEVMKLVGATDDYVRRPFIIEGAVQGAIGSLCAVLLVGVLFLVVQSRVDSEFVLLVGVAPRFLPWHAALGMVTVGAVLGASSAYASLRKLLGV